MICPQISRSGCICPHSRSGCLRSRWYVDDSQDFIESRWDSIAHCLQWFEGRSGCRCPPSRSLPAVSIRRYTSMIIETSSSLVADSIAFLLLRDVCLRSAVSMWSMVWLKRWNPNCLQWFVRSATSMISKSRVESALSMSTFQICYVDEQAKASDKPSPQM